MTTPTEGAQKLPQRRIGRDGPMVSVLSLGSWHTWDRMDFHAAVDLVHHALDAGLNFFDVAHYDVGPHTEGLHSDVIFGRVMEAAEVKRSDYVLSEKLWLWNYPDPRRNLTEQLKHSLFRIGTDHADVLSVSDFTGELDVEHVIPEIAEIIRAGLAQCWGYNQWSAADVIKAHEFATREGMPTPQMTQIKYSVCRRAIVEGEPYRRVLDELGVTLQPSDVFEGGILVGKYEPSRRIGADVGGIREQIIAVGHALEDLGRELDLTPAQIALSVPLTHPSTTTVLVGVSHLSQLMDNLSAVAVAQARGAELKARLDEFWLDRGIVDPSASWATNREFAANMSRADMNSMETREDVAERKQHSVAVRSGAAAHGEA